MKPNKPRGEINKDKDLYIKKLEKRIHNQRVAIRQQEYFISIQTKGWVLRAKRQLKRIRELETNFEREE